MRTLIVLQRASATEAYGEATVLTDQLEKVSFSNELLTNKLRDLQQPQIELRLQVKGNGGNKNL